jgi:hypothetical protein
LESCFRNGTRFGNQLSETEPVSETRLPKRLPFRIRAFRNGSRFGYVLSETLIRNDRPKRRSETASVSDTLFRNNHPKRIWETISAVLKKTRFQSFLDSHKP